MKIAALSDFHGRLVDVPQCDLCIIAGDFTPIESHEFSFQQAWLRDSFRPWLETIPAKKIIGIAGNHDVLFDHGKESGYPVPDLPWTYLENTETEFEGIKIFGTPYQSKFNGWPFMRKEYELKKMWADMPKCDLVVSHGPPYGVADIGGNGKRTGMKTLTNKLTELEIPHCICGHMHENYGAFYAPTSSHYVPHQLPVLYYTSIYNVALCDNHYDIRYKPLIIEI
jgi:Icc-related predicted phosphoesterase